MENVKYIPGDLVRSNNNPKIIWKVKDVSQDKRGNVLYRLIAVEEEDAFVYLYEPQIASIPLAPAILEANGWKLIQQGIDDEGFEYGKYFKDYQFPTLIFYPHIRGQAQNMSALINGKDIKDNLLYCHQLQHFLFGLGLDSSLKV